MGQIFKTLEKYRNKKFLEKSEELKFFNRYKGLLKINQNFFDYLEIDDEFDVIKANIIIKSIINKEELDRLFDESLSIEELAHNKDKFNEYFEENIKELTHINYEEFKIYIPFFTAATNSVYYREHEKMKDYPYFGLKKKYDSFVIDPFLTYNLSLFDSGFVNLIKISENNTCTAYFHKEFNSILIINNQGSIDNIIYLFDRFIKNPNKSNIITRLEALVEAYFSNEMNDFINILYKNNFISYFIFNKICKKKGIL